MYRIFGNVQNFSYQKFFIIGSSRFSRSIFSTFVSIQEGGRKGTKKGLWHFFAHSVLEALPQAKKVWRVYTQKVIIMVMLAMSIYF